jgi:hypothetical protein
VKLLFYKTLKIRGVLVRSMPSYSGAPWVDWIIADLGPPAAPTSAAGSSSIGAATSASVVGAGNATVLGRDAHWYACQVHSLFAIDVPGTSLPITRYRSYHLLVSKYVGAQLLHKGVNASLPQSLHPSTGLPLIARTAEAIVVAASQVVGGLWVVEDPDNVETLKWVLTDRRFSKPRIIK